MAKMLELDAHLDSNASRLRQIGREWKSEVQCITLLSKLAPLFSKGGRHTSSENIESSLLCADTSEFLIQ